MLLGVLGVLAVCMSGCSGTTSAVPVTPPSAVTGGAACAGLIAALPSSLDGHPRRTTTPASDRTAAWGKPTITLVCGVPALSGDAGTHVTIDGLTWVEPGQDGDVVVWTTSGLSVTVRLSVPASVDDQENVLGGLTAALTGSFSRVPVPSPTAATAGASAPISSAAPSPAASAS